MGERGEGVRGNPARGVPLGRPSGSEVIAPPHGGIARGEPEEGARRLSSPIQEKNPYRKYI